MGRGWNRERPGKWVRLVDTSSVRFKDLCWVSKQISWCRIKDVHGGGWGFLRERNERRPLVAPWLTQNTAVTILMPLFLHVLGNVGCP